MPDNEKTLAVTQKTEKTTVRLIFEGVGKFIGKGLEVIGEGIKLVPGLQGAGAAVTISGLALQGVSGAPKALEATQQASVGKAAAWYGALVLKVVGTAIAIVVSGPIGGAVAGTLLFSGDIMDGIQKIIKGQETNDATKTAFGVLNVGVAGTGIALVGATLAFPPSAAVTVPALLATGVVQAISAGASAIVKYLGPKKDTAEITIPVQIQIEPPKPVEQARDHKSGYGPKPKHHVVKNMTFSEQPEPAKTPVKGRVVVPTVFNFPEPAIGGPQVRGAKTTPPDPGQPGPHRWRR